MYTLFSKNTVISKSRIDETAIGLDSDIMKEFDELCNEFSLSTNAAFGKMM